MRSKIKKAAKPNKDVAYPYLGEHEDKTIVLFLSYEYGVIVYAEDDGENYLGELGDWNESEFTATKKKVVLSND